MTKNPKISVIIPTYNAEKTLKKCLNSVLNQTCKNYEIIIVDNNSTDKTKDIIKEFQQKNKSKKIKYLFEPKIGGGAARNAGIIKAKGKIILMTDSDCIVPKNWIQEIIKPIIYENESVVMGFEKDLIKNFWTKNIQKANLEFFKRNLHGKYISHIDTKNLAIKSSIMKRLMFNPQLKTSEDFDLYLQLKKITKIRFVPSIAVWHNHKSSFIDVIKMNFNRAYWIVKIYDKYKKNYNFKNETVTESLSIMNFIKFPFWMILQFIRKPLCNSFFTLVSELSWRIGILWAEIK